MNFAIFRCAKIKTKDDIKGAAAHQSRTQATPNADIRGEVVRLHGPKDHAKEAISQIPDGSRKNAVLCMDVFVGASAGYFRPDVPSDAGKFEQQKMEAWRDRSVMWLRKEYGDNLISAHLHLDESTPHIQALVIPLLDGKLNAKKLFNPISITKMQDRYAASVADIGLQRGVERSTAEHIDIKDYYQIVNSPTPQPKTKIPPLPKLTKKDAIKEIAGFENGYGKAMQSRETAIKKRFEEERDIRKSLDAKAKYADLSKENQEKLATVANDLKKVAAEVREIPFPHIFERFGYIKDKSDKNNWNGERGRISTDHGVLPKFYNHDVNQGGGGAIDLAMHLGNWNFKEATTWLAAEFGSSAAIGAALSRATVEAKEAMKQPTPKLPVPEPTADKRKIKRVRDYLTKKRALSSKLVDGLMRKGLVFADSYCNACFKLSGGGVELRGTGEQRFHGVRGEKKGMFQIMTSQNPVRTIYVESAIDALSYYELHRQDRAPTLICSITGASKNALQGHAQREIAQGRRVVAGFDRDKAGNHYIEQLREIIQDVEEDRPTSKDFNDDLCGLRQERLQIPHKTIETPIDNTVGSAEICVQDYGSAHGMGM
jgi:hypothetical protein